jgi:hypothetical protein
VLAAAPAARELLAYASNPPSPSSAELEDATLQTVETAWKAHDAEKLGSAYAPNARVALSGFPDANGKEALEEVARSFWTAFPDAKYAWSRSWRAAGVAVVESAWTGTNMGALPGGKPTHRTAGGVALTLTWFAPDGLIREQHVYADAESIAMQLGLTHGTGRPFEGLPTSREEHSANGTVVEQMNVEGVKQAFLRVLQGDRKGFLSSVAEDAEYVDFTRPGSRKGRGATEGWFRAWTSASSDPDVSPVATNVWGVEDYVIREYQAPRAAAGADATDVAGSKPQPRATHESAPKGARRSSGVEVFQIQDRQWLRVWSYANARETAPHAR